MNTAIFAHRISDDDLVPGSRAQQLQGLDAALRRAQGAADALHALAEGVQRTDERIPLDCDSLVFALDALRCEIRDARGLAYALEAARP